VLTSVGVNDEVGNNVICFECDKYFDAIFKVTHDFVCNKDITWCVYLKILVLDSYIMNLQQNIQGGSKKVSCWHSTTAYFFEPPCISPHAVATNMNITEKNVLLGMLSEATKNMHWKCRLFPNFYEPKSAKFGLWGTLVYVKQIWAPMMGLCSPIWCRPLHPTLTTSPD